MPNKTKGQILKLIREIRLRTWIRNTAQTDQLTIKESSCSNAVLRPADVFFLSHRVSTWFAVEGMFASFRLSYFSFLVTLCVWKLYNRYEPKARLARHLCRLRDCFWCVCVCALSQLCNRGHKIWFKTIFKRIKLGIHRDLFFIYFSWHSFFLNIPYVCSRVNLVELRRYFFSLCGNAKQPRFLSQSR